VTPYYDDGTVALYHGDARVIVPELDLSDVAAVVTDPPYGDTSLPWDRWQTGWIDALPAAVRQMWCFGSMRMFLAHHGEFERAGWAYAQEVVWEKHNGSGFHADRFKRVHEFATHWYRGPWSSLDVTPQFVAEATARTVRRKTRPAHTGHIEASAYRSVDGGPKLQRSVIYCRSMHGSAIHPTEKPVGILEPLIRYSSAPGDLILDPFAGSGAVLDAARLASRRAVGVEADERYCEVASARLSQAVLAL
jgi:site-specific DNA-methyltransferase (adenine-specific)